MNEELDQDHDPKLLNDLDRLGRNFIWVVTDNDGMALNDVSRLPDSDAFYILKELVRAFSFNWGDSDTERCRSSLRTFREQVRAYRVPHDLDPRYDRDDYEVQVEGVKRELCKVLDGFLKESGTAVQKEQLPPTFRELLGEKNLAAALEVIKELGYSTTVAKGKGRIVGAMVGAFEFYRINTPEDRHWPYMLNEQFKGIKASAKAVPSVMRQGTTNAYQDARSAMLDRLRG
jgi:hypothetical protein